jgi:hypothetical protein
MSDKPTAIYMVKSENDLKEIEKIYNDFINQYDISIHRTELIVEKMVNGIGITISPKEGDIYQISALKDGSELEIILKEIDLRENCESSIFETKDKKFIIVNYKNKNKKE